jgi:putative endonuclease
MAEHTELGKEGEKLAEQYLIRNGYTIIYRNWRYSHLEIDIIAEKNGMLHIIEVKARSSKDSGLPEDNVHSKKFRRLLRATDEFLYRNPQYKDFRIDILAITKQPDGDEFFLIEDVYW